MKLVENNNLFFDQKLLLKTGFAHFPLFMHLILRKEYETYQIDTYHM